MRSALEIGHLALLNPTVATRSPGGLDKIRRGLSPVLAVLAVIGWVAAASMFAIYTGQIGGLNARIAQLEQAAGKLADIEAKEAHARSALAADQTEMAATDHTLAGRQAQLDKTRKDLTKFTSDLATSTSAYHRLQDEISAKRTELSSLKDEVKQAQGQLATTRTEISNVDKATPLPAPTVPAVKPRTATVWKAGNIGKAIAPREQDGRNPIDTIGTICRTLTC